VALLEKSRIGADLTWQELQSLAGFFEVYQASPGSYVCHQGERSDFICLVCQGRLEVMKGDHNQKFKVIATIGPGQTVGEMAIIDGEPRSASVLVQTQALLLVLTEEQFDRMAETLPRLWGKILRQLAKILSRRLRQTSGMLAEYIQG
jgi:CRP-like cAMP-binding protein